ncbi:hypothetical protein AGDE_13112 [Angomonas deanei]|uniref:Uncharacterized protein n=1 Tax=Angomonas deanei TaxID=59799 RepID=A0A7G2CG85_9TRYP|nr:hypothetical protein AGDE_13112 [Angomonas deanei]CAD2218529.1 hypothetical protein, conserved [Angomonas deanei]|eukprot:EPY22718.1 hypothetical protein AGDE_13112 [Angomonas deanei]
MAMPPPLSDGTGDWFSNFQNYFVRYVSSKLKHPPSSHGNAERVEHMRIFLMRTAMEIGLLEVGRILVKVFLISEENGGGDEMFSTAEMRDLTSLEEEAGDIFEFKEGRLVSVVEKCFKQDPLEALGLPTSTENTSVNQMVLEENLKLKNRVAEGDTFSTLKSLLLSVAQALNGNEKGIRVPPTPRGRGERGRRIPHGRKRLRTPFVISAVKSSRMRMAWRYTRGGCIGMSSHRRGPSPPARRSAKIPREWSPWKTTTINHHSRPRRRTSRPRKPMQRRAHRCTTSVIFNSDQPVKGAHR